MQVNLDDGKAESRHLGLLQPLRFHGKLLLLRTAYLKGNLAEIRDLNDQGVF